MIDTPPSVHPFPKLLHHLSPMWRAQRSPTTSTVKFAGSVFFPKTPFPSFPWLSIFHFSWVNRAELVYREFWGNQLILAPFLTNEETAVGGDWVVLSRQTDRLRPRQAHHNLTPAEWWGQQMCLMELRRGVPRSQTEGNGNGRNQKWSYLS